VTAPDVNLVLTVDALTPPLSGIGRYTLELARRLPLAREIRSIRFWSHGMWITDPETLLKATRLNAVRKSSLLRNRVTRRIYGYARPWFARATLRSLGDHILHSPNFHLMPFPGRTVATFHDLSFYRYPQYHPPARMEFMAREVPRALEHADMIIADSEFGRREIVDYLGFPEARTRVVPLGVDPSFRPRLESELTPTLQRYGLSPGGYALYVGTIEPRKNLTHLIAAYRRLNPALRERFPLVLCGAEGWGGSALQQQIRAAVDQGWAKYLGYVPEAELPHLFAGARCFAFPSFYEGFGLPVLESMASGVPVVTSDRSSMPEVTGGAAQLVDPEDVTAIAEALGVALEDQTWRETARERGLAVARGFTWERTIDETIATYRALG
jgi:glycosyltransferase involved in cell wall biosynthesis